MNRIPMEKMAEAAVIAPLADYVCDVGMHKALKDYSKPEIEGLIQVVLETYHTTLQTSIGEDIPF